ncbi:putative site-specific integrase-resolvase [Sphingomonas sp. SORGH_AS802]|uniref:helix-turn-helix transcriptional regulator n=1 Tax=unclassified Sphingomonas TaxID=196159 RepID=UPI00285FD987|nr:MULTISPECIES: helix-turn-helix domain-containing protein [unclassified Sphingomonas]MDR6127927.1 putative site-specific integrase-resolvase [Sphingomonas sp. SORGH_AS_0438]MDR6133163.1 putative site-specific integrase-resolvase [Sphingomonas sp. SORGH_AS_0802]
MSLIDPDLPALLTTTEAAACLSVSPKTLAYWRAIGEGPAFAQLGVRSIRYRREDLTAYITGRRRLNNVAMQSRHSTETQA